MCNVSAEIMLIGNIIIIAILNKKKNEFQIELFFPFLGYTSYVYRGCIDGVQDQTCSIYGSYGYCYCSGDRCNGECSGSDCIAKLAPNIKTCYVCDTYLRSWMQRHVNFIGFQPNLPGSFLLYLVLQVV